MIAAIALTVVLVLLTGFQIALIAGVPWGRFAWGGQHEVLPTRLRRASVLSIVIYAGIPVIELDRAGAFQLIPDPVSVIAAWAVFGYFALGIVLNLISRSVPERALMTPVAAVLAVLSLLVALS